ncbi:unnamed protein product [Prorocentrum cordatum]|uniref:Uncharacterized protein n=1 Tax=Prorocentrum cordatum TaxID=2364126 RepID=A0ABN9XES1_9DINO|nr:unnamed protein product [Polarella glacialis]
MFTPADELPKKRDAGEAGVEGINLSAKGTEVAGISKKDRQMTKLLLLREDNFRGTARDQNVVVRLRVCPQMQVVLESSTAYYQKAGKDAKGKVTAADLLGQKLDDYLCMLLFRLSVAVVARPEEVVMVVAAAAHGTNPQESAPALMMLVEFGMRPKGPEARIKATRCFDVKAPTTIDGEEGEEAKWIFAVMSHPTVKAAPCVLKANGGRKYVSLLPEDDEAPRSKTAKELEKLIFK